MDPASARQAGREQPDVRSWRRAQLSKAGFAEELADELLCGGVDIHALIGLTELGCPPPTAARILAPLEREPPAQ